MFIAAWGNEHHMASESPAFKSVPQDSPSSLVDWASALDIVGGDPGLLAEVLEVALPDAGFYLWAKVDKLTKITDTEFAKRLYAEYNVTVLPGSYVAREAHGINPGANRVRMALVAESDECVEAARRIVQFVRERR